MKVLNQTILTLAALVSTSLVAMACQPIQPISATPTEATVQSGYAAVNGLEIYYEIHGTGRPLIVLHGAYMTIESMAAVVSSLAESRQVIAIELQGHGRTADRDRPLSYEQMADDVAGLMQEIGIDQADFFGYSMGGNTAIQVAIRHPERVGKLVTVSSTYNREGWYPEVLALIETITPEIFAGSPIEEEYMRLAPNPDFPALVTKLTQLSIGEQAWPAEVLQQIRAPMLIINGDSDNVRPEHALGLFHLRGGGIPGDLAGLPNAQLAIIPGATHISIMNRVNLLTLLTVEFLDAPTPEAE
jgi:pimeloyl-ACP methyl ester carboxylesterase